MAGALVASHVVGQGLQTFRNEHAQPAPRCHHAGSPARCNVNHATATIPTANLESLDRVHRWIATAKTLRVIGVSGQGWPINVLRLGQVYFFVFRWGVLVAV
jgi:hypothetical protein